MQIIPEIKHHVSFHMEINNQLVLESNKLTFLKKKLVEKKVSHDTEDETCLCYIKKHFGQM